MTHFPSHLRKRPLAALVASLAPVREAMMRDILWGRPLFRAPVLINPNVEVEPLPFTPTRVTQRSERR
jgi:hypothetical protein